MFKKNQSIVKLISKEFGELRTLTRPNGQVWFALVDVCKTLEIGNSRDVRRRLTSGGVDTIDVSTSSSNQHGATFEKVTPLTFINEPNLYRCIFQSRKAEAVRFQDWVFDVVLPNLRKPYLFISPGPIAGIDPIFSEGYWLYPLKKLTKAVGYGNKASERWTKRAKEETRLISGVRYATSRLANFIEETAKARKALVSAKERYATELFPDLQIEE